MKTKDYLSQVGRLNKMINNKLSEISQLRELSVSISAIGNDEKVQTSPNFDKIGTAIAKIDELENNLDKMIDEYLVKRERIIAQIDTMEEESVYQIVFSRYIEKKTFEKIATEMEYSWRQIVRLHGKALQQFEKKYGEEYL